MGFDRYHADEAARRAAVLRGVDYSFQQMMKSPLVQRWFAITGSTEPARRGLTKKSTTDRVQMI